jgi:hypothetical protein
MAKVSGILNNTNDYVVGLLTLTLNLTQASLMIFIVRLITANKKSASSRCARSAEFLTAGASPANNAKLSVWLNPVNVSLNGNSAGKTALHAVTRLKQK